jgi:hypothetical protein
MSECFLLTRCVRCWQVTDSSLRASHWRFFATRFKSPWTRSDPSPLSLPSLLLSLCAAAYSLCVLLAFVMAVRFCPPFSSVPCITASRFWCWRQCVCPAEWAVKAMCAPSPLRCIRGSKACGRWYRTRNPPPSPSSSAHLCLACGMQVLAMCAWPSSYLGHLNKAHLPQDVYDLFVGRQRLENPHLFKALAQQQLAASAGGAAAGSGSAFVPVVHSEHSVSGGGGSGLIEPGSYASVSGSSQDPSHHVHINNSLNAPNQPLPPYRSKEHYQRRLK